MTTHKETHERREKDAARIFAHVKKHGEVKPDSLLMLLGECPDFYSCHWRSVMDLAKELGLQSSGSGRHRVYFVGKRATK